MLCTHERFRPVPYWTGYYATRPLLKKLHNASVRALVGAEALGCLLDSTQRKVTASWLANRAARLAAIGQGWANAIPSNHHDFVTGTSMNVVYTGEQVPMLESALAAGLGARALALSRIASLVEAEPQAAEAAVVVANPLGFDRSTFGVGVPSCGALVSVAAPATPVNSVCYTDDGAALPVQAVSDDEVLVLAGARSFGYSTLYLSPQVLPEVETGLSVCSSSDGLVITLENPFLQVEIAAAANWGITKLVDKATTADVLATNGVGNDLCFYQDGGDVYEFGNEGRQGYSGWTLQGSLAPGTATILEQGPLRARVTTTATWTNAEAGPCTVIRDYELVCNEPLLRMTTTGAAPQGYSVVVAFPLPEAITSIAHGTSSHWDGELPTIYWTDQTFQPTHDFVLVSAASGYVGAVYHLAVPAWGASYSGTAPPLPGDVLFGCLFRNVTEPPAATDPPPVPYCDGQQTVTYAFRVPTGIQAPTTGGPLQEAMAYHTPLVALVVPAPPAVDVTAEPRLAGSLPTTSSLVSVSPACAMVTAAKPAETAPEDLILRIYQPTNEAFEVTVTLGSAATPSVTVLSAREQPLGASGGGAPTITTTPGGFSFTATNAITTFSLASYLLSPSYPG